MEIEASLAGRELVTLPQSLFSRIGIKSLDLSRNQIHEVPIELSHLLNLRTLNLSKNKLDDKSFPPVLENLVFLEELNLAGNNLTEIPSFVMNLPRLKVLKSWKRIFFTRFLGSQAGRKQNHIHPISTFQSEQPGTTLPRRQPALNNSSKGDLSRN
jgi:hypothetical protein